MDGIGDDARDCANSDNRRRRQLHPLVVCPYKHYIRKSFSSPSFCTDQVHGILFVTHTVSLLLVVVVVVLLLLLLSSLVLSITFCTK